MTSHVSALVMSPPAITPESTVPKAASRKAWQREMEKVQMESWFKPPVLLKPTGVDLTNIRSVHTVTQPVSWAFRTAPEMIEQLGGDGVAISSASQNVTASLKSVVEAALGRCESEGNDAQRPFAAMLSRQAEHVGYTDFDIDVLKLHDESSFQCSQPVSIQAGTQGGDCSSSSIRVHAEWQDSYACVWLGVDVGQLESLGGVNQLALKLQQTLANEGRCLVSLICNGHEIYLSHGQETQTSGLFSELGFGREKSLDKLVNSFQREE